MTWTRLSDDFTDRPEMLEISRSARLLHIEAMVWCNRMLTNGKIPAAAIRRITDTDDVAENVNQLAKVGLWSSVVDEPDAWQLDWSDQEGAEEVKERQRYQAEKQKRYRDRKSKHDRGDHTTCDPRFCKSAVTGNATSNKTGLVTPSRPDPSRPLGRDREQERQGDSARAPSHGARDEAAWAEIEESGLSHRFVEDLKENDGLCDCGLTARDPVHGHRYIACSAAFSACRTCDEPATHPVHLEIL